jgi:hypothetical protein
MKYNRYGSMIVSCRMLTLRLCEKSTFSTEIHRCHRTSADIPLTRRRPLPSIPLNATRESPTHTY